MGQLSDEVVGLLQHGTVFAWSIRESSDDPVVGDVDCQRDAAAVVDGGEAALLHQRQDAKDLAGAVLVPLLLDALAQHAYVLARCTRAVEQLLDLRWRPWTAILGIDPEEAVLRA